MAETERALLLALSALAPLRDLLVVVGGTAQRLFPRHALGQDPGFELLTTEDVDIAAPVELGYQRGTDLLALLLYVHDTLAVFADNLLVLGREAQELVPKLSPQESKNLRKRVRTLPDMTEVMSEVSALAEASRANAPSSTAIAAALARGLPRLLSSLGVAGG